MHRHCLIAVSIAVCLWGCTAPAPEKIGQDPNVTPEGIRITPDVVYGHKLGMALTLICTNPKTAMAPV